MIEFHDIKKSFGEKVVLDGVSHTMETGKTNLIIGTSGSGKTVLQKCLVGLFEPDEGEILYDGKSFTDMTSFPFAKMYGEHKIVEKEGKIELTATIKVDGALSFLWERLVAKNVADKLEEDMDAMIRLVKADG